MPYRTFDLQIIKILFDCQFSAIFMFNQTIEEKLDELGKFKST
jgi:hypothetical protein